VDPKWKPLSELAVEMVNSRPLDATGQWIGGTNDVDKQWCPHNSYYESLPVHVATLPVDGSSVTWSASCFNNMQATFTVNAGSGGVITLDARNNSQADCDDWYLFSGASWNYWLDVGTKNSNRTVTIKAWHSQDEWQDLQANGMQVMIMPCGIKGTIESAIKTVGLFIGDDIVKPNMDFLLERKVYPAPWVKFGKEQVIDAKLIKSGFYLAIAKLDGLDPLVMWGTGGRTGHSAVLVWEGDQLYVCESTDANPFGKVYWPPPYGIIRTPYLQWIKQAKEAGFLVNLLPMHSKYASQFDENRFWTWFKSVQGMPYGYHNFLYSFLDTDPNQNLPKPIDLAVLTWIITTADRLLPNSTQGVSMFALLTEGLNHRLNTQCGDIACIVRKLRATHSNLAAAVAIPEDDSWIYDGKNQSMVCSAFAARSWLHGLGSAIPAFMGTEQTPKDNYQMQMFDGNYFTKQNCPIGIASDPTGSGNYCQLIGDYAMPLNGYNTIPLYAGMNSHCPAQWPDYVRCPPNNPQCC
jgi:hypothetical protein